MLSPRYMGYAYRSQSGYIRANFTDVKPGKQEWKETSMIKMLTACTEEIDEIDDAVNEILTQLDLKNNMAENSVGIISCDPEFVQSGAAAAISKKLPFDTVGVTTRAGATHGVFSSIMFGISVITSDEVKFSVVRSKEINSENVDDVISSAYKEGCGRLPGKAELVLAYPPIIPSIGIYPMVNAIFKVAGNTPVFGTLACSHFSDHRNSFTLVNGVAESSSAAMVLMSGGIHPDFFMVSIPAQNLQQQYGIITKSEGCNVYTVNDMSFKTYLEKLGFPETNINVDSLYMIPFMINFGDGNPPIARALYSINSKGIAVFGDGMPEGKTISLGSLNYGGILQTTGELLSQISAKKNINGILFYSCIVRQILLGVKNDDELKEIIQAAEKIAPYHICYSGGEICPVKNKDGEFVNHAHNYTLIACVF
jgi:hypothetical protein